MRVRVTEDSVEVLLAPWEKVLGLLGNIRVARTDVSDVRVLQEPMREVMSLMERIASSLPGIT